MKCNCEEHPATYEGGGWKCSNCGKIRPADFDPFAGPDSEWRCNRCGRVIERFRGWEQISLNGKRTFYCDNCAKTEFQVSESDSRIRGGVKTNL